MDVAAPRNLDSHRMVAFLLAWCWATAAHGADADAILDPEGGLRGGRIGHVGGASSTWRPADGYRIRLPQPDSHFVVLFEPEARWTDRTHLDVDVANEGDESAVLTLAVSSRRGDGWLTSKVTLGPRTAVRLAMPLETAAALGTVALPSLPGDRNLLASFGTFHPDRIGGFFLYNAGKGAADIILSRVATARRSAPVGPLVDRYGQQRSLDWPGKVRSDGDLRHPERVDGRWPYAADRFGGILEPRHYGRAPRFRTQKDGDRWFLVTPEGSRFFSFGVNEVGVMSWTVTDGREHLFSDLAALRRLHPDQFLLRSGRNGFYPYGINLERKYGPSWRSRSERSFQDRMRSWGFNTFGAHPWDAFLIQQEIPSTLLVEIREGHRRLEVYDGQTMPDVFDPGYRASVVQALGTRMRQGPFSHHPHNLGFFVDNEMPWGRVGSPEPKYRYALAVAALNAPVDQPARRRLLEQLKRRYDTIEALNEAWGSGYRGWTDLESGAFGYPPALSQAARKEFEQFAADFAREYFSTVRQSLGVLGYAGLYLGCRFKDTDYTPEIARAGLGLVDVHSVNIYRLTPDQLNADLRQLDVPILISEVSFGATDFGRVGLPLNPTLTEEERVRAFRRFMDNARTWPNIVGVHWYRWEDFPVTGNQNRENMSMGLVSITDKPYPQMVDEARRVAIEIMADLRHGG
jgi:hypothetical protein